VCAAKKKKKEMWHAGTRVAAKDANRRAKGVRVTAGTNSICKDKQCLTVEKGGGGGGGRCENAAYNIEDEIAFLGRHRSCMGF